MNIRRAETPEDLDVMGKMAARFATESQFVKVNPALPRHSYWPMVESGIAAVFMLEHEGIAVGGLGCIKFPDLHSGTLTAVETFWYVDPDHRGHGLALFEAYEHWAIENGCQMIAMIHMVDSMPDVLERFYKRRGYQLVEKHYMKEIKP